MSFTKCACAQCGRSGKYSFHLIRGTVCFQCGGSGSQMIDLKNQAARQQAVAAAARHQSKVAHHDAMRAVYNAFVAEMNVQFGKRTHVIRDERLCDSKLTPIEFSATN